MRLEGDWNEEYTFRTPKKACPLCGYPMQLKYKRAYGLRLYICTNEPEVCGFMTNDINGGKMAIQKCDKCRDGYLIIKHGKKHEYFLGCTNYQANGTGCNKTISMKYYYDQMHYTMEEPPSAPQATPANASTKLVPTATSQEKVSLVNPELDDYVEIKRADVKPVLYGEWNLNDVVFTVVKALQNVSKYRFYNAKVLTDVLTGTGSERVVKNNLGQVPEFRALREMQYDTVEAIVEWMISQHFILKTKERYPVLHSTYDGLHYSEFITEGKLKKLKKYLEEEVVLWK